MEEIYSTVHHFILMGLMGKGQGFQSLSDSFKKAVVWQAIINTSTIEEACSLLQIHRNSFYRYVKQYGLYEDNALLQLKRGNGGNFEYAQRHARQSIKTITDKNTIRK